MAWCPKCKSEYVDGVTVCVDCGCELVDHLEEKTEKQDDADDFEQIDMADPVWDQEDDFYDEEEPQRIYQGIYVNNEERAEENRTSAYTLLIVGSVGLAAVLLLFFDILPIDLTAESKYMISGVMGVLFLLFLIMGIIAFRKSKILKGKANTENNLTREIRNWCLENLDQEKIDDLLNLEGQKEELKYFQRTDYIKQEIQKQFMNLDEGYLDRLVEETYNAMFESEEA